MERELSLDELMDEALSSPTTVEEEEIPKLSSIVETNELPSKGKIYGAKAGLQFISLRAMNGLEELRRSNPNAAFQYKNNADLIEGCLTTKPKVHVYDWALGDYVFALHKLRTITYGSEYKMTVACPHCGKVFNGLTDLDQELVKDFSEEELAKLKVVTLPESKNILELRLQTPRILDDIAVKARELSKKFPDQPLNFALLTLLKNSIVSIDDKPVDSFGITEYIKRMHAYDLMVLINAIDALNSYIGITDKLFLICPECNGEIITTFREGPEFFRPTTVKSERSNLE